MNSEHHDWHRQVSAAGSTNWIHVPHDKPQPIVIEPDGTPSPLDLDALQRELDTSTANLILPEPHPEPAPTVGTALETVPTDAQTALQPPPAALRTIHTATVPARIKDAFIEGEGVIAVWFLATCGVAAATGAALYSGLMELTSFVSTNIASIIGLLLLVLALLLLSGKGKGPQRVKVKGCPKTNPGSYWIYAWKK